MPPATITVRVLLFAHLRRQAEAPEFMAELPLGATVRDLAERLQHSGLNLRGCAAAVNEMYAALDTPLQNGDEVAFLPPVAGGAGGEGEELTLVTVTPQPLSLAAAELFWCGPALGRRAIL